MWVQHALIIKVKAPFGDRDKERNLRFTSEIWPAIKLSILHATYSRKQNRVQDGACNLIKNI